MVEPAASSHSVTSAELRRALGKFPTGVAIATTRGSANRPVGLTINSFASVSLDPPLVLWSIARSAGSLAAFEANDRFAINVLADHQEKICRQFCRDVDDRFDDVDWFESGSGMPLIRGAVAMFDCRVEARHDGGDHVILLGRVEDLCRTGERPLVFYEGATRTLEGYGRVQKAGASHGA